MSSTKTTGNRIRLAMASFLVCATCLSSLSYAPEAQAQDLAIEAEPVQAATTVEVAVAAAAAGAAFAAVGWIANKTYDLGKEVGRWLAGPSEEPAQQAELASLSGPGLDYALD